MPNVNSILFFLTPKAKVAYLDEDFTIRQALEKMEYHHYSAIPILASDGKFKGVLSEGDVLWYLKNKNFDVAIEDVPMLNIPRNRKYECISIRTTMNFLVEIIEKQNFVPVLDDNDIFIGIITRKAVIEYLQNEVLSH